MTPKLFAASLLFLFALQGLPQVDAVTAPPTLIPTPPPPSPGFGYPGIPQWDHYPAPIGTVGAESAREPAIGASWNSGNTLFKGGINTYRIVWDDSVLPPVARWELATPPDNIEENPTFYEPDPFLYTDHETGRTWSGSRVTGCPSVSWTDDDGQHWYPSAVPCTGGLGWDNVTWASAPYMNDPEGTFPKVLYLCGTTFYGQGATDVRPSMLPMPPQPVPDPWGTVAPLVPQDLGEALTCVVSHDGGNTFLANMTIGGSLGAGGCSGRFGHVETDHRGWAYVPSSACGNATPGFYYVKDQPHRLWPDGSGPPAPTWTEDETIPQYIEWQVANVDCGGQPCGTINRPPAVSLSLPSEDGASDGGVLWYANAEQDGIYIGKATFNSTTDDWDWHPIAGNLTGKPFFTFRPTGSLNLVSCATPPFTGSTYFNIASLAFDAGCQRPVEALFPTVIAGDDERAAIGFIGSRSTSQGASNICGVISDGYVWYHFVAMTIDGGRNWTIEQTSDHPIQIGGIWTDHVYEPDKMAMIDPDFVFDPDMVPPCANQGMWHDVTMDEDGRPLFALSDGCVPWPVGSTAVCNAGGAGDDSNEAWATIVRLSTGCGLRGAFDHPTPYWCEAYIRDGHDQAAWVSSPPLPRPYGDVTIQDPPVPPATYPYDEGLSVRGIVERDWVYPPLAFAPSEYPGLDVSTITSANVPIGESRMFVANVTGGHATFEPSIFHNKYACHWAGSADVLVHDDLRCFGTPVTVLAPGTHTLRFVAYDKYDHNLAISKTVTLTGTASPRGVCPDPLTTDPQYDVRPYMYLQGQKRLEGADLDVRRICVSDIVSGENGRFETIIQMEDLEHLTLPGGGGMGNGENWYGVAFCLDNNMGQVCYGAVSEVNGGVRQVTAGVLKAAAPFGNPARMLLENKLCVLPDLLDESLPSGNAMSEVDDIVKFRFRRESFNVLQAPTDCGVVSRTGAKLVDGTVLTRLAAGAERPGDVALNDWTMPETGIQTPYRFMPRAADAITANAFGIYETVPFSPVITAPHVRGAFASVQCEWVVPEEPWHMAVYDFESAGEFVDPSEETSCLGTQIYFEDPGIYQLNFTATDAGGTYVDHVLFLVRDSEPCPVRKPPVVGVDRITAGCTWREHVLLYYDQSTPLLVPGRPADDPDPFKFWVDTRYTGTGAFGRDIDLPTLVELTGKPQLALPGVHTITARWVDHNKTIIDNHTVSFIVEWPGPLGTPPPTFPDPRRPTEGVDPVIGGDAFDQDGDSIADRFDLCPFQPSGNGDMDGDGIGDECDDDRDGDGIPNAQDNCKWTTNADQRDTDNDGFGDACPPTLDSDKDTTPDARDVCPFVPDDQTDTDNDGFGDACDVDRDGDGVANMFDGCPDDVRYQRDTDGDGLCDGDPAELDSDNDGYPDSVELSPEHNTDPFDRTSHPREPVGEASFHTVAESSKSSWWMLAVVVGVVLLVVALLAWLVLPRRDETD